MHEDIKALMKRWQARRATLLQERGVQRGVFDSLIADFMAPVAASAASLSRRQIISSRKSRKTSAYFDAKRTEEKDNRWHRDLHTGGLQRSKKQKRKKHETPESTEWPRRWTEQWTPRSREEREAVEGRKDIRSKKRAEWEALEQGQVAEEDSLAKVDRDQMARKKEASSARKEAKRQRRQAEREAD